MLQDKYAECKTIGTMGSSDSSGIICFYPTKINLKQIEISLTKAGKIELKQGKSKIILDYDSICFIFSTMGSLFDLKTLKEEQDKFQKKEIKRSLQTQLRSLK
jgi:hypothetical protein